MYSLGLYGENENLGLVSYSNSELFVFHDLPQTRGVWDTSYNKRYSRPLKWKNRNIQVGTVS